MKHQQNLQDQVLWHLVSHNGRLTRSSLRRRMKIKQADVDCILDELVDQGKIKRLESGADKRGRQKQTIALM